MNSLLFQNTHPVMGNGVAHENPLYYTMYTACGQWGALTLLAISWNSSMTKYMNKFQNRLTFQWMSVLCISWQICPRSSYINVKTVVEQIVAEFSPVQFKFWLTGQLLLLCRVHSNQSKMAETSLGNADKTWCPHIENFENRHLQTEFETSTEYIKSPVYSQLLSVHKIVTC